ncbi:MAG: trans-sulfuration enzyme family protein [Niabella sp.]
MGTQNFCKSIASAAVHSGHQQQGEKAHIIPIFATSVFTFDSAEQGMNRFSGEEPGYIYSRFGNPTTTAAQEAVANLESFGIKNADGSDLQLKALLFASGQAAMATLFISLLKEGDVVLSNSTIYAGTFEFFTEVLTDYNIKTVFADLSNPEHIEELIRQNPEIKIIHIESPANPTMSCLDIEAISAIANKYSIKLSIDNTFATPYLQQPFKYGVDFVFHSTTKFLNGHGNAMGGVLLGKDVELMNTKVTKTQKLLGGHSNPFDAFLLLNGIKTLAIRMEKHCSNAQQVAEFLNAHEAVAIVNFNGLKAHPGYAISQKQMRHAGSVLSFELKGGLDAGKKFINGLKMCTRAVSLGTVDTLVSHPASMSHAKMKPEDRAKAGISEGLIRMSVGIEDAEDILNDLEQALTAI